MLARTSRPADITSEALSAIRSPGPVDVSADGATVLFQRTLLDLALDAAVTTTYVHGPGRDAATALPAGERRAPRLSPDATLVAYLRAAGRVAQLHVEELGGAGPARQLTAAPEGVVGFAWAPDGRMLVASAGALAPEGAGAPWVAGPERVRRDGRPGPLPPGRLLAVPLDGSVVELTAGGDDRAPAVSPDGRWVAFARLRRAVAGRPLADVWRVALGGGEARRVSTDLAFAVSPSWSPDGGEIACYGTREPRLGAEDASLRVWRLPAAGGESRRVAPSLDRGVPVPALPAAAPGPAWSPAGDELIFPVADAGNVHLVAARVDGDGGVRRVVDGERQVVAHAASATRIAFAATSAFEPGEVATTDPGWARARDRPRPRGASGAERVLDPGAGAPVPGLRVERRPFAVPGGARLDGWLLGPDRPWEAAPLLVTLHGGPHGFAGSGFAAGHIHRHVLAGRGWLVLALSATGSGSYGRDFADAIRGRWGEADLPEHLAAVDALVASGEADPGRLAVAGYSYGGYLAAWAVAHDDRFRAALAGAPIADLRTFWATSDIGPWFVPFEMGTEPGDDAERYAALSPVTHAHRIRTPLLIVCGEADERCPIGEAEQLHAAVRATGRAPVELVRYPGAGHLFFSGGRPSHRVDYNRRVVEWMERWAGTAQADSSTA